MPLAPYLQTGPFTGSTPGPSSTNSVNAAYFRGLSSNYPSYVNNYITVPTQLLNPDPTGKYDTIDNSGNLIYKYDNLTNPNPNLQDAMIDDRQSLLAQQNTMYILGTVTCVTLIVAAIMLSSNR